MGRQIARPKDGRSNVAQARTASQAASMSYRPITDVMILARRKGKYYAGFPAGFLPRARHEIECNASDRVLFICAGKVSENDGRKVGGIPLTGFYPQDITVDIDPETNPTVLFDVRELDRVANAGDALLWPPVGNPTPAPRGAIIDRDYTPEDADKHATGRETWPANLDKLLADTLRLVPVGSCVGVLDYLTPRPPKSAALVAHFAVTTMYGGRERAFNVYRRLK